VAQVRAEKEQLAKDVARVIDRYDNEASSLAERLG